MEWHEISDSVWAANEAEEEEEEEEEEGKDEESGWLFSRQICGNSELSHTTVSFLQLASVLIVHSV